MSEKVNFVYGVQLEQKDIDKLDSVKSNYQEFKIPKKHGGFRTIEAPCDELKELQHKIARLMNFEKTYSSLSMAAQGFRPKHSTFTNAKLHNSMNYLLNIDLKDFFPSITSDKVVKTFKTLLSLSETDAIRLAEVFTYNGHLPQGGPYSPMISNFVCNVLDKKIQTFCIRFHGTYSRYADDITISWNDINVIGCYYDKKQRAVSKYLQQLVESEGFTINNKKTFYSGINGHKEVTGIIVNKFPNAPKDYYYRLRSIVNDCLKHGNEEACKHYFEKKGIAYSESKMSEFLSVVKGMMAYYTMIRGTNLSNNERYNRLAKKVNIVLGKKYFKTYDNLDELIVKAEEGDVEAQYQLGCGEYITNIPFMNKQKTNYWLKVAAINGHDEAIKTLLKNNKSFDTPDEKIRWVKRCKSYNEQTKTKIIYDTIKNNFGGKREEVFNLLRESYESGEFFFCHLLGSKYASGDGCEFDANKAKEVLEYGAKKNNYYCKAMLMTHAFADGDINKTLEIANEIKDEHDMVENLRAKDQYKYFTSRGYTYYKDGLRSLNESDQIAYKYIVLDKINRIDSNDSNVVDNNALIFSLESCEYNDITGIVSIELCKLYLEGKLVEKSIEKANEHLLRSANKLDYMPKAYKELRDKYESIIKSELPKEKDAEQPQSDNYYLITPKSDYLPY